MSEERDRDRDVILARRRRFIARALTGPEASKARSVALAASTLSLAACPRPQVCLNAPPPPPMEILPEDPEEPEASETGTSEVDAPESDETQTETT